MATRFEHFFDGGYAAYRASRNREAALLYSQAREAARLVQDKVRTFRAGFWEAHSWEQLGELKRAYAQFFMLLAEADDDTPILERWLAEKHAFELWCALGRRTRSERLERLGRLEEFAATHPTVPAADLPQLRARHEIEGARWTAALEQCEKAWTLHADDTGGYVKSGMALGAIEVLLRLGRSTDASRWLDLLGRTDQDKPFGRRAYHMAQALSALHAAQGSQSTALEVSLLALEDDLAGTEAMDNAEMRHVLVRLWLLLRPYQNPADPFHPARAALRHRPEGRHNWDRTICLTDYHLACLRYLVGSPPCDDYYHGHPPSEPSLTVESPKAIARQLCRMRAALNFAYRFAAERDEDNETDWYTNEVSAREERLATVLTALKGQQHGE